MASSVLFRLHFRRCLHHSASVNKNKGEKYDLGIKFKYSLGSNREESLDKSEIQSEKWTLRSKNETRSNENRVYLSRNLLETAETTDKSMNTNSKHLAVKPNRLKRKQLPLKGEVLFGISPVSIALELERRVIHRLFLRRGSNPRIDEVVTLATDRGVTIESVDTKTLDRLSEGRPHQGVCLDASRLRFAAQENDDTLTSNGNLWLFLDKIHDPMNLGAIIRSAYYFGVDRIVTVHGNTCPLTPVVSKASSGAMEIVEVYRTKESIGLLKSMALNGWEIVGTSSADGFNDDKTIVRLGKFEWPQNTVILIGNEGLGLSFEHLELCQKILTVPSRRDLHPKMQSLNVGVATGVILQNASIQLNKINIL